MTREKNLKNADFSKKPGELGKQTSMNTKAIEKIVPVLLSLSCLKKAGTPAQREQR